LRSAPRRIDWLVSLLPLPRRPAIRENLVSTNRRPHSAGHHHRPGGRFSVGNDFHGAGLASWGMVLANRLSRTGGQVALGGLFRHKASGDTVVTVPTAAH
jgi:hypothetical protein